MTVSVSNTLANSSTTVGHFRSRVNELASAMTAKVVTTDSNSAVGNAAITGTFEASVLVSNAIGGGNTTASNTLFFTTQTSFSLNTSFNSHVHLGVGANVHVLVGNATHRFVVANNGGVNGLAASRVGMSDLDDFSTVGPAEGQVLVFNNSSGKWINQNAAPKATDATSLGGQPNSFYTNASNFGTGTIPSARVNGAYASITAVGNLATLNVTGNTYVGRLGVGNVAPAVSVHITANDAVLFPVGNTSQRPAGSNGMFRYNSETGAFEGYVSGSWGGISSFTGGTLTSKLTTVASNTAGSGLNVPHGAAPSAPNNGDFWSTTTGAFVRINGSTKTVAFLEGATFTGVAAFQANVTAQNVGGNYFTVTTIDAARHVAGNSTANAAMNSSSIVIANSSQSGSLVIADLNREYFIGTIMGVMSQHLFPITLVNYNPFPVTILSVKMKLDVGSFTNATMWINTGSANNNINNLVSKSISTTLQTFTPASNNVLQVGDALVINTNGDASDWNLSFFVELGK